jgi:release factor glutamine methyltransferase
MVTPEENVTVKVVWRALVKVFQETGLSEPVADARLLMQWVTGMPHEELLMKGDKFVTSDEQARLQQAIDRRMKAEPVSRIIGRRAFWKHDFKITPDTLDPRPDSETLIMASLHHAGESRTILDLGTGTGCLLLSLLGEWPAATGIGLDINVETVKVAGENARALGMSARATFIAMDWEKFNGGPFDLIISNPPYIAETERGDLMPEVVLYDPPLALFGGPDGLDAYRSIARLAPNWLTLGGKLVLEIGHAQGNSVKSILVEAGWDVIEIRPDLAGLDRCVVAKRH